MLINQKQLLKRDIAILIIVIASSLTIGGVVFFLSNETNRYIYQAYGYWVLWGLSTFLCLALWNLKVNWKSLLKNNRYVFWGILLMCAVVYFRYPGFPRLVNDELITIAMSQTMAFRQDHFMTSEGLMFLDGNPIDVGEKHYDKRPGIYPFLVHLFHLLSGTLLHCFYPNFWH